MSRGTRLQKYFGEDSIVVQCMRPNGDCFYCAVSHALSCENTHISVSALRDIVASFVSEDLLDMYKSYYSAQVEGYNFMKQVHSTEQLQDLIKKRGTERGNCVWADEFAIQQISNFCNITFLIVNESARNIAQNIIRPNNNTVEISSTEKSEIMNINNNTPQTKEKGEREKTETGKSETTNDSPQLTISNSSISTPQDNSQQNNTIPKNDISTKNESPTKNEVKYVVLQLTRHMHYNLVGYVANYLFTNKTLPHAFAAKFGIGPSEKRRDLLSYLDAPPSKRKK